MQVTWHAADDILVLRVSDRPIVRETSQDWYTTVSHAADDSVVEVVVLDASKQGAWPLKQAA